MKKHNVYSCGAVRGFSLIELVVTMAIVGILATIAYGSYSRQVLKSHRTEAKTALLDLAGREEKLYSTMNVYSSSFKDLGYSTTDTSSMNVGSNYYNVTISGVTAGPPATFTLTATPINSQTTDTECTQFKVDQTGAQTSTGTSTTCW